MYIYYIYAIICVRICIYIYIHYVSFRLSCSPWNHERPAKMIRCIFWCMAPLATAPRPAPTKQSSNGRCFGVTAWGEASDWPSCRGKSCRMTWASHLPAHKITWARMFHSALDGDVHLFGFSFIIMHIDLYLRMHAKIYICICTYMMHESIHHFFSGPPTLNTPKSTPRLRRGKNEPCHFHGWWWC